MPIHGLPIPIHDPRATRADERAATVRDHAAAGTTAAGTTAGNAASARPSAPVGDVSPARPTGRLSGVLPADAPPGTDPALWSVLTTEERAFFAKMSTQGPLTYTKLMANQVSAVPAAMPRGSRMDVRV